jgi:hypothetical protein
LTGANGGTQTPVGYAGLSSLINISDYECSDTTMHLANRDSQVEKVLEMDALGRATWKQSLWIINYFQQMHDYLGAQWSNVATTDQAQVGQPGNTVVPNNGDPTMGVGVAGTYIGTSDLEGFQGLTMTEEIDNKAVLLLTQLTSNDAMSLGGFSNLLSALNYDYTTPLRYFPHAIAVTEQPGTAGAEEQPTTFTLQDATSQLPDLTALIGGFSEIFAVTDANNSQVGGAQPALVVFDGDPFPADDGQPDGEQTLHDRALAVLKVALVNLDRLHLDSKTGVLVDTAQLTKGSGGLTVSRSTHATTVEVVYSLVALRAAYRSLTSQLTEYSDATPDHVALHSALDGTSMAGAPGGATMAARIRQLLFAQAEFMRQKLVDSTGLAYNGYDIGSNAPDSTPLAVESQAAMVRGLLEAYLVTSDVSYRDLGQKAYGVLDTQFFHPALRVYRPTQGEETNFVFTPSRFGIIQSALRQMYIQIGAAPGNDALRAELETRIGRLNKLVLNGWDDRNANNHVDYPQECMNVQGGLPRSGLQMGERALTAELGLYHGQLTGELDADCVPNLSYVNLPATLASQIVLTPASQM